MEKIRLLEAPKGSIPSDQDQARDFGIPVFIEHLNDLECVENANIKFKCKVEPKNDPTLQIGKNNFFIFLNKKSIINIMFLRLFTAKGVWLEVGLNKV